MGRTKRKKIASGTGGQFKWTDKQRQCLMLCYKLWDFHHQEVNTLIHLVYPEFRNGGKRNYTYDHTRDEYKHRFKPGRSSRWRTIDRPNPKNKTPYTPAESNELHRVQLMIEAAAAAGGIALVPVANAPFPQLTVIAAAAATEESEEDGEEDEEQSGRAEAAVDEMQVDGDDVDANERSGEDEDGANEVEAGEDEAQAGCDEANEDYTESPDGAEGTSPIPNVVGSLNRVQAEEEEDEEEEEVSPESSRITATRPREEDDEDEPVEDAEPARKRRKTADGSLALANTQDQANTLDEETATIDSAVETPSPEPFIKTVVIPRVDDADQAKMTMVHLQDLRWDPNIVSTYHNAKNKYGVEAWIDRTSDSVYFTGGSVQYVKYHVLNDYEYKHVMVCDEDVCRICNPNAGSVEIEDAEGRPFVHRGEGRDFETFDEEKNVYILKKDDFMLQKNDLRPYDNERHEYFELGMIQFEDNGSKRVRSAYVCQPESCPSCRKNPEGFDNDKVLRDMRDMQDKTFKGPKWGGK